MENDFFLIIFVILSFGVPLAIKWFIVSSIVDTWDKLDNFLDK